MMFSVRRHAFKLHSMVNFELTPKLSADGEDLKRDLAEIEITPYSLLRRFENGKVERVLLPVDKRECRSVSHTSL